MKTAELLQMIAAVLGTLFAVCSSYQLFYLLLPHIKKEKTRRPPRLHDYAVLICARNEQTVIGPLLQSIRAQDYPAQHITVFVAADNCTDATAAEARACGAVVYERTDTQHIGKGYTLQFLLENIRRDCGDRFDGFFVFDADNLLRSNYITEMNKVFSDGCAIVTSCRNSKNYGRNWISAGYGLWFLREAEYLNHARALLGVSCGVSGTGFLFSAEVLHRRGGWNFHLLTEDIQFTAANVLAGNLVGYCPTAEFFDEQPVTFAQSWRQRMRWAKGYIQVFCHYGRQLLAGMISPKQPGGWRRRFSCFDLIMVNLPVVVFGAVGAVIQLASLAVSLCGGVPFCVAAAPLGELLLGSYLYFLFWGGVTTLSQWRRIRASAWKKLLYTLTFPLFMMTYLPIGVAALFAKVEWKPIRHTEALSLQDLEHCR